MRKITIIMLIGLFTATMLTGCGKKQEKVNEESQAKVNTSSDVIKDQSVEVFEFTNTSLIYSEGMTRFETTVTNTSAETSYLSEFKIHVKDKEGKEVEQLIGFVGEQLKAKESRVISSYSTMDLSGAFSIEYEVVR